MSKKSITWETILPSCFISKKSNPKLNISNISNPIESDLHVLTFDKLQFESDLHVFTLDELKIITNNFSYTSNLIGEGGFGAVFKGFIDDKFIPRLKAQDTEVIFLGQLRHPHLVKLIGYCCEDKKKVLIYEYMAGGNVDNLLFERDFLNFVHDMILYRGLCNYNFKAKLTPDFAYVRDGPDEDNIHETIEHILRAKGYVAPEYVALGHLTTMSDVYSFGVVLLELLTGKRYMDKNRPEREHCLV
ncbi:Serine/threonine-protein kinase RIPK [Bienertia sinuspersici]